MSNTVTLSQEAAALELKKKAFDIDQEQALHGKEIALYHTFLKRLDAGEFPNADTARAAVNFVFGNICSEETKDALEAEIVADRDWKVLNDAYKQRIKDSQKLDENWAQARADLQARMGGVHKGNGFTRTASMERNQDGSVTIPAEMVEILLKATEWCNKGKIQKVSGFVNATES